MKVGVSLRSFGQKWIPKSVPWHLAGRFCGLLVFSLWLCLPVAYAEEQAEEQPPVDLSADEIEYDRGKGLYVADGNVVVHQGNRTLVADWLAYNNLTRRGVASGEVVITEGQDQLRSNFVEFNIDTLQGVSFNASLDAQSNEFKLSGEEIERTGEDTYRFKKGTFSTCDCPEEEEKDPWEIQADEADLEINGYGTLKNGHFDVLDVPVIWLPWMIYPLKTERQSGFLFPELGTSSLSGGDFALPFFWAARDNLNLTLTPRHLSDRGWKPEVLGEYVFGEESWGDFFASSIHDQHDDFKDKDLPYSKNRWGGYWNHDQFLPADWRLKMDVNLMSDNDYLFDFGKIDGAISGRSLESRGFLEKHFGRSEFLGLVAGGSYTNDLQAPDDLDRDDLDLQRLGDVHLSLLSRPLPGPFSSFLSAMNVDFTNYRPREDERDEYSPSIVGDDIFADVGIDAQLGTGTEGEGNGLFDEGEPLMDRGQRVQLSPRVSLPLRIADSVEFLGEVGYVETLVDSRAQGFEQRGVATGRLDLRTRLEKQYTALFSGNPMKHLLEPRLGYAIISSSGDEDDPLFLPGTALPQTRLRRLDLRNVTLDSADRVDRYNGAVAGVRNRFYREEEGQASRLVFDADFSVDYVISDDEFGRASIDTKYYPWKRIWFGAEGDYDIGESEIKEGVVSANGKLEQGSSLAAVYRYRRDIPEFYEDYDSDRFDGFEDDFERIEQLGLESRAVLGKRWAATWDMDYSFELSRSINKRGGLEYLSKCDCWKLRVEYFNHYTRGSAWRLTYALTGLGRDHEFD